MIEKNNVTDLIYLFIYLYIHNIHTQFIYNNIYTMFSMFLLFALMWCHVINLATVPAAVTDPAAGTIEATRPSKVKTHYLLHK